MLIEAGSSSALINISVNTQNYLSLSHNSPLGIVFYLFARNRNYNVDGFIKTTLGP